MFIGVSNDFFEVYLVLTLQQCVYEYVGTLSMKDFYFKSIKTYAITFIVLFFDFSEIYDISEIQNTQKADHKRIVLHGVYIE